MELTYYPVAASSFCTFFGVYKYVSPKLSARHFPGYNALPHAKQVEWNSRTVSTLHAVIVSVVCLYILVNEEQLSTDPVWGQSWVARVNCAAVIGYMMSDTVIMVLYYPTIDLGYILHHFASCYAFYYVTTYGVLTWFANFRLIAELSTAFVNQRWFLDALSYPRTSPLFMANGIAMAAVFFIARIVCIPPFWVKVISIWGTPACNEIGYMFWVMVGTCAVLDTLNILWMAKIWRGASKIIKMAHDENRNVKAKAA